MTSSFLKIIVGLNRKKNFSKGKDIPMDINSIQGMNVYTANALMADTPCVQDNNNALDLTGMDRVLSDFSFAV